MEGTFVEALQNMVWSEIDSKLHTSVPGIIQSYDPEGPTVEVKPAMKKRYVDGTILEYPTIVSVPVVFPRTARFQMTFPLEKGDGVLLVFSERSIEAWMKSGKASTPSNTTKFSLTDGIAIPGLFGVGFGSKIEDDGKNVKIAFDDTAVVLDGKDYEITNGQSKISSSGSSTVIGAGGITSPLAGVVTGECLCSLTGLPHPQYSSKVKVEK